MRRLIIVLVTSVAILSTFCEDEENLLGFHNWNKGLHVINVNKFQLEPGFSTRGNRAEFYLQFIDDATWKITIEKSSGYLDMHIAICTVWNDVDEYCSGWNDHRFLIEDSKPKTVTFDFQSNEVYCISFDDYYPNKNTAKIIFEKL